MNGFILFLCIFLVGLCDGNLYNPHLFPDQGPFFEGWYMRLVDTYQGHSFAVLFGTVLPQSANGSRHPATITLLHGQPGQQLQSYSAFPSIDSINITVNDGQPVTSNPDRTSPTWFTVSIRENGYVKVKDNGTVIDVTVDTIHFTASLGKPVPWAKNGYGPGGWLDDLPLPLHWFVYSLKSRILQYVWRDSSTGQSITGSSGYAHMEKNWGKSFPEAWIWTQGLSLDEKQSFALSYGPVTFVPNLNIPGHLFGYRNQKKGIDVNFTPVDSVRKSTELGCNGTVSLTITGLNTWKSAYKVELEISANTSTFSGYLYGPTVSGFKQVAVESYDAVASVKLYKTSWFKWKLIDSVVMKYAALEFGGSYMCHQPGVSST